MSPHTSKPSIIVFTDGAALGNPGPGGWGAIMVTPSAEVTELGGGVAHTTNNQMELTAVIEALAHVRRAATPVELFTDSTYVIRGITQWIHGWRKRGWTTAEGGAVLNRDLWERLAPLVEQYGRGGIVWHYVRGHTGIPGNERADEIATSFARQRSPELYHGPLRGYSIAVLDLPDDTSLPRAASSTAGSTKKAAPHSYLSVVDGKLMRHATWAECERRVKGRSGARFKKAMSAADEASILRAWGYSPRDIG